MLERRALPAGTLAPRRSADFFVLLLGVLLLGPGLLGACEGDGAGSGGADVRPADVAADAGAGGDAAGSDAGADDAAGGTYWRAGAAEASVTPERDLVLGGYGICGGGLANCRWSAGVHDDLRVTAFAVEEAASGELLVFASVDALGLMMDDVLAIQDAFVARLAAAGRTVPRDRLVVSASHSHATPDSVGLYGSAPNETGRDPAYLAALREQVAQTAVDAVSALADAELEVARGWHDNAPDVLAEDLPMEMDGRLTVLRATRPDGTPVFTLTSWPSHPTVYPEQNNGVSADWVGTFRHALGERLGAGVHGHLQGPIGGVYAVSPPHGEPTDTSDCADENPFVDGWADPDLTPADHQRVACVGVAVADAAVAALSGDDVAPLAPGPVTVRTVSIHVPVKNPIYKVLADTGMIPREIPPPNDPVGAPSHMTLARLGQLRFVTAPGEAFPRYARALRERVAEKDGGSPEDVVVVGLGNDWVGYLLLPEQYEHPAYGYHRGLSPGPGCLAAQLAGIDELTGQPSEAPMGAPAED